MSRRGTSQVGPDQRYWRRRANQRVRKARRKVSFLRWSLILIFMFLKAGFIVAIFMHMYWEKVALIYAILMPPLAILVLIALMALEGDYTFLMREIFFVAEDFIPMPIHH